ncbi:MAG TPA: cytochrome c oxidase accessory protein CcoG, partial [Aquaticitalea sp.]|nr:cytochrome c oxidase accessory protein CcoG [Aquaticitalea sp.]
KIRNFKGEVKLVSTTEDFNVPAQGMAEGTLFIEISKNDIKDDKNKLIIDVYSHDRLIETTTVNFLGPRSYH